MICMFIITNTGCRRFLNLETAQEYETLPEGIDPSMVKYTWDEIVSQDGNVVGYECLENNAYLAFNKKHTVYF